MTNKRILAAKIAQNVANHIEGTGTIIVQNMEEVIHDALLLDGAKRIDNPVEPEPSEFVKFIRRKQHPWWQVEPGPEAGE